MKSIRYKVILFAVLATFAGACVVNVDDEEESVPVVGDAERLVTLALSLPGSPGTRAMDTDENVVDAIDVFLFNASDQFCYRALGSSITDASTDEIVKKNFNVRLPEGEWKVVVLANARGAIAASKKADDLVPATPSTAGLSRKVVLDGIAQQLGNPADRWADEFNRIPMWGHGEIEIDLDTPTPATQLSLTRAVVRVDLSVASAAQANFSMTKAYLYNYSRAGSVAPAVDGAGYLLAQPHLPDVDLLVNNSALVVPAAPLEYDIPDGKKHEFKHESYTFEAGNTSGNTCLVIGGKYKAITGDVVTTYYRVDFVDGEDNYLALLRNHNYNVQIKEVNGHGYPTKEDAYANKPANIVVTIVPWDEGGMNDVEFNGQHYLSVDKSELVFYANGASKSLHVITDFPEGWTVPSVPAWLEVFAPEPAEGEADERAELVLNTIAGGAREDFFYIVAGNLK
jgi:hypothetical protein